MSRIKNFFILLLNFLIISTIIFLTSILLTGGFDYEFYGITLSGNRLSKPTFYLLSLLLIKYLIHTNFRNNIQIYSLKCVKDKKILFFYLLTSLTLTALLITLYLFFPQKNIWNLDLESGFGTAFSGLLLFGVAFLSLFIYAFEKNNNIPKKKIWIPIVALFILLAFDEIFSLHEWLAAPNIINKFTNQQPFLSKLSWITLYIPVFIITTGYFIYFIFIKLFKSRAAIISLILAGIAYTLSITDEAIMLIFNLRGSEFHIIQVASEEGLELLGTILVLVSFSFYYKKIVTTNYN